MNNRYVDLIDQTFYFPQEGFDIDSNGYLEFNGVPLKYLIEKYGTPFKVFYLPKMEIAKEYGFEILKTFDKIKKLNSIYF